MDIIRYTSHQSESGAYIFAPGHVSRPMKLTALDAFLIKGEI